MPGILDFGECQGPQGKRVIRIETFFRGQGARLVVRCGRGTWLRQAPFFGLGLSLDDR